LEALPPTFNICSEPATLIELTMAPLAVAFRPVNGFLAVIKMKNAGTQTRTSNTDLLGLISVNRQLQQLFLASFNPEWELQVRSFSSPSTAVGRLDCSRESQQDASDR
jgi:hypothetical protein